MPNREGGYGGYQSSQPQQNRMPRKVNAPGSGKVRRGVDPTGLGAQRPPQRPTRPAQQPPEPLPRRRTAERPAAQPQPVHRAAPRPQQRSSYHAQQPNRGSAPHPRLCCKPRLPDRRGILAGTAAGILLLAGVITLLLPSNKAVENVPVGTEQTAQAGRLVAPVPYADSDGSGNGGPSIDWGTIGPVQQAETYTYTAAPQAPDMVPEFGRVSTDWFSDAAFLGDSLTAGIAYYDINVGGALVLGYEGTSPNQIVNRTALKNTNEDDAEQVPLDILAEQQPAKLYLLIGTNALAGLGNDEGFLAYYGKLLDELQSTLPNSMIFVQSILNVRPEALDQAPGLTPERVGSMNDKIKEMCKERGFYYLNLTEAFTGEDGYLTADYAVMRERTEAFLEGIRLVNLFLRASKVVIAIEEKNRELETVFAPFLAQPRYAGFRVKVVSGGYPQGSQWQLVRAVTGLELAPPQHSAEKGIVVSNVATVYAVWLAVMEKRPVVSRILTVSGEGVEHPGNVEVPIGTPVGYVLEQMGVSPNRYTIVLGGPMMGRLVTDWSSPVTKGTNGVLVFERQAVKRENCIGCGRCIDACPMRLMPLKYAEGWRLGNLAMMERHDLSLCVECGACESVCPSNVPLMASIVSGKARLRERSPS